MGVSIKFKNILDVGTSIVLRKLGFGKFDNLRRLISIEDYGGEVPDMDLWLIPADKYDEIPKGYQVTDIFGKTEPFEGRKTCCKSDVGPNGLLPIGVLRPAEECKATEALRSILFVTSRRLLLDGKVIEADTECYDRRMLRYAIEAYTVIEEAKPDNGSASVRLHMLDKTAANKLANDFSRYKSDMLKYIKQLFKSITDCGCGIITTDEDDMSVIIYKFSSSSANIVGRAKLHTEVCKYLHDNFNINVN